MRVRSFHREQVRLPLGVYCGNLICTVTTCTERRAPAFRFTGLVALSIDALATASGKHAITVLAYCFMPDHLHLMLHNTGRSSIVSFMRDFKQTTGFAYKRTTGRTLWQKSYYDHALRRDEELFVQAWYIFGNPVRVGLVECAADYSFSGSLGSNLRYGRLKPSATFHPS